MCFNPRALTSPDCLLEVFRWQIFVSIHGLLRALTVRCNPRNCQVGFNPRALTSPDSVQRPYSSGIEVSIHGLLRALTKEGKEIPTLPGSFNPRALTSPDARVDWYRYWSFVSIHGLLRALTLMISDLILLIRFQSTGSYEP